jgi:hypothetical protein
LFILLFWISFFSTIFLFFCEVVLQEYAKISPF